MIISGRVLDKQKKTLRREMIRWNIALTSNVRLFRNIRYFMRKRRGFGCYSFRRTHRRYNTPRQITNWRWI